MKLRSRRKGYDPEQRRRIQRKIDFLKKVKKKKKIEGIGKKKNE